MDDKGERERFGKDAGRGPTRKLESAGETDPECEQEGTARNLGRGEALDPSHAQQVTQNTVVERKGREDENQPIRGAGGDLGA